jgi:hypothetical protein
MRKALAVLGIAMLAAGCTFTTRAADFSGLTDFEGEQVAHQSTTNVAVHLLMKDPLWGDASLENTVAEFTAAAKGAGASQTRIVQSSTCCYWWVLPPISFVVHPVVGNVAGDTR